jgi:hypothetical protein
MEAARAVEKSFAGARKPLPINVDGAIEEQTREKPMRRIDPVNHGSDGPTPRSSPA